MGEFELEQTPLIDESSNIIRASEIRVGSGSDAAFRATPDGVNITGLNQGSLLDIQGWTFAGTFSATDADTVAWTTGALTFSDGTSYTISAGNTGNMAAITYIYFSKAVSTTVLQTTTTAATSVGANKVLICVAKNETGKNATFQAFNSKGIGALITADNIAANTITTNEIATNTIVAGNMNVSQLSAIAADCGTITAGTITGATIRTAAPSASSHETVVIEGGTSQFIKFYYDTDLRAWIKGYTTEGSEVSYLIIEAASGRKITLKNSYVSVNGNFMPSSDREHTCGGSNNEWSDVVTHDIHCSGDGWADHWYTNDLSFTDRYCPSCKKQFKKGDSLVMTVTKTGRRKYNDKEKRWIMDTVPIHLKCAIK